MFQNNAYTPSVFTVMIPLGIMGFLVFLTSLPYLILNFKSSFYRERFYKIFRINLPTKTESQTSIIENVINTPESQPFINDEIKGNINPEDNLNERKEEKND